MRKFTALFIILLLVLVVFAAGCSKEEENGRKLASRPVKAEPKSTASTPSSTVVDDSADEEEVEDVQETRSTLSAGQADCEQLSSSDVAEVMGGSWSKATDCPIRPTMPAGVDVCRCDYDGPKQVFVNVETQLYDDSNEAERVYNMYCSGTAEESEVGTYSCRVARTNDLRPNYVYFLKDDYLVKVSCLGGSCPFSALVDLAEKVDAQI